MKPSLHTPKARVKIVASSSHHEPKNWATFSTLLIGLIIFFSATQLGLHFWPNSSLVYGVRVDYLSPTLYFLDLLIICYLLMRRLFDRRREQSSSRDAEGGRSLLAGVTPILLLNFLYSSNPLATLSWSLHFLLYCAFMGRLFDRRPEQSSSRDAEGGRSLLVDILRLFLPIALLFQLALAITQVSLGHSVGSLMYYLGERSVAVGQPSVALATFMDTVVLRAYGTFSHPNILAGWAVVSLLITLSLKQNKNYRVLSAIVVSAIVLLTQSRSAALALFALVIPFYIIKNLKLRIIYFSIFFCSLFFVQPFLIPSRSDLSITQRLDLQGLSSQVIANYPIFGTGSQASISTYPSVSPSTRLLQPDHNSFTLFLSWFGVFGIIAILYSLRPYSIHHTLYTILPLAPPLLLDHYLLTSPQGLFIILLYLRLALNYPHAQNDRQ